MRITVVRTRELMDRRTRAYLYAHERQKARTCSFIGAYTAHPDHEVHATLRTYLFDLPPALNAVGYWLFDKEFA
jgi:hypothetical protein